MLLFFFSCRGPSNHGLNAGLPISASNAKPFTCHTATQPSSIVLASWAWRRCRRPPRTPSTSPPIRPTLGISDQALPAMHAAAGVKKLLWSVDEDQYYTPKRREIIREHLRLGRRASYNVWNQMDYPLNANGLCRRRSQVRSRQAQLQRSSWHWSSLRSPDQRETNTSSPPFCTELTATCLTPATCKWMSPLQIANGIHHPPTKVKIKTSNSLIPIWLTATAWISI